MASPILRYAALAVILLSLAAALLYYRGEATAARLQRDAARQALNVAMEANKQQQAAIERITKLRDQSDRLLEQFISVAERINTDQAEITASVIDLKEANSDVRALLSTAVPDDLRRVLNKR